MSKKHPLRSSSIILLTAIVAILVTFFVIKPNKENSQKEKDNSLLLYPTTEREQVLEIVLNSQDQALSITRSAENSTEWHVGQDGLKYPADKNAVEGIISSVLASKKESEVNNVDAASVGLMPPKFAIKVPTAHTKDTKTLLIGNDTNVDYLVYAKWENEPTIFTTSRSLRFTVEKKINDLRNKKVMGDLKESDLSKITIQTSKKEGLEPNKLEFERNTETNDWNSVGKFTTKLDKNEVNKWVTGLSNTSIKTFLSESEKDKFQFGMNSKLATITLTTKANKEIKWNVGVYTENKEKKYSISQNSQPSTYEVTSTFLDNFKLDLFKFRDKKITGFDSSEVNRISISAKDQPSLEFTKKGNAWTFVVDEQPVQAKKEVVENAIRAITELRADKFHDTSSDKSLGFQSPQRVINIERNGEKEPILLIFGKSLAPDEVVVKSSQASTPASVAIDLEKTLSVDPTAYIDERKSPASKKQAKGDAVKMEATITNLKDLKKLPEPITKAGYEYSAKMVLQDGKEFEIIFDAEAAPYTVSNFLHLARNGFYSNVKFHRVIADFVAQGGDPTGTGSGGPGWKFHDEQNNLTHQRGVLSMANAGPNTNGSQFFVVLQPQPHLNGKHTVFGKITKGIDLIDKIKAGDVMKSVEVFERSK